MAGTLTTSPVSPGTNKREKDLAAEVVQLKAQLAKNDGVLAAIAQEYTQRKKELGEP